MTDNDSSKTSGGRGGFFAIDRRLLPVLIDLGMNAFVSYIVMCRGTGADHLTTSWSVHAIEQRTAVSRAGANAAITALIERGLVTQTKTGKRPRYRLSPASEVRHLLPAEAAPEPDFTWLPNELVDGAAGEASPIEVLRQTHNRSALWLMIECYGAHALVDHGGISRHALRTNFDRQLIVERGQWAIWRFRPTNSFLGSGSRLPASVFMTGEMETVDGKVRDKGQPVFWRALNLLLRLGLIAPVAHLLDSDGDEGMTIHPLPCPGGAGEPGEHAITAAAHTAALAIADGSACDPGVIATSDLLVPVMRHIEHAAVAGIFRLRYRPKTGATAAWLAHTAEWAAWVERYDQITADAAAGSAGTRPCNIKAPRFA